MYSSSMIMNEDTEFSLSYENEIREQTHYG